MWDADSRIATIDTADPVTIRKLDKLAEQYPEEYHLVSEDLIYKAKRYEVPAKYIRFSKPASEVQRMMARKNSPYKAGECSKSEGLQEVYTVGQWIAPPAS